MRGPARGLAIVLVLAAAVGGACQRSPDGARRAPSTAPSEWAAQRGSETGSPDAASVRPPDPRNEMPGEHDDRPWSFMTTAGLVVLGVGAVIAVTVWRLEARRRRVGSRE
jgi:hypothetical protein